MGVKTLMDNYVVTYNEVMKNLIAMGANDPVDPDNDGALIGDSTLREIMKELREMSTTALSGYEGGPYYLSNLGIGTQRDGTMTFDPKKLEKMFKAKPDSVRAFLVIIFQQVIPTLLLVPSISDSPSQGLMHFPPMVLHIPLEEYQQLKVAISIQSHRVILKGLKLRLLMEAALLRAQSITAKVLSID